MREVVCGTLNFKGKFVFQDASNRIKHVSHINLVDILRNYVHRPPGYEVFNELCNGSLSHFIQNVI